MRPRSWTDQDLIHAVSVSKSLKAVTRILGISYGGRGTVKRHIERLALSTEHFTSERPRVLSSDAEYFVAGVGRSNVRARLLLRRERKCEMCDLTEWMGRPTPIQVDHINGDKLDNRLENLRLLCPNCHAQTPTYGGANKSSVRAKRELTKL